jgi:hypothetical protein
MTSQTKKIKKNKKLPPKPQLKSSSLRSIFDEATTAWTSKTRADIRSLIPIARRLVFEDAIVEARNFEQLMAKSAIFRIYNANFIN